MYFNFFPCSFLNFVLYLLALFINWFHNQETICDVYFVIFSRKLFTRSRYQCWKYVTVIQLCIVIYDMFVFVVNNLKYFTYFKLPSFVY